MNKVVLDTNVVFDLLHFRDATARPLLQALEDRGLRWRTEPLADGGAWVAILRPAA